MSKFRSRPASALLIVLGMMAFILVSALAFSAYMRSARLPSSYLRRTSASRLLVKAALARAIETVDRSIADYPHPGVPNAGNNIWRNRVMFGQTTNSVTVADTVSPLTLEGLAYIPTPLVNDVRYYSRLSPTCTWQALGFDSGRFSFCAVDVSDYFDLNRVTSSSPRSSATNQRVSFAYLFENEDHTDAEAGSKQWDKMMDDYREPDKDTLEVSYDSKYPLISWADFNLALGARGALGSIRSPFYDYAMEKGGDTRFYGGGGAKERDLFRRMTFVTDSVNSGSEDDDTTDNDANNNNAATVEKYNILDPANQPFPMDTLMADRLGASEAIIGTSMNSGKAKGEYLQKLSGLGCAALRDYLDPDHYPSSLAVPTTERTPMIAGFRTLFQGSKLAVEKRYAKIETDAGTTTPDDAVNEVQVIDAHNKLVQKTVKYCLAAGDFLAGGKAGVVSPVVVFPFNHPDENDKQSYAVGGRFSLFWTNERQPLRTDNVVDNFLCLKSSADKKFNEQTEFNQNVSLCNIKLMDANYSVPKAVERATDSGVVKQLALRFVNPESLAGKMAQDNRNVMLSVTYQWKQTDLVGGMVSPLGFSPTFTQLLNSGSLGTQASIVKASSEMRLMDTKGNAVRLGANGDMTDFVQKGQEQVLYLNSALWLWVKDGSRFVDLVPASLYDDQIVNPQVNDMAMRQLYGGEKKNLGEAYPLMKLPLDGGSEFEFKFSLANLEALVSTPRDIKSELSAMVCDPRFNYAPEHWFTVGSLDEKTWLRNCRAPNAGQGEEDKDIFLATSDAGYLQSKYELAMLPRLTNLLGPGNRLATGNLAPFGTGRYQIPASEGDAVNQNFMWSHYDPFDTDLAAFEELKLESRGPGLKVNPYSDSTNVLMAAFGNTPIDWKRASTNKVSGTSECAADFQGQADDFNQDYAWNDIGSKEKGQPRIKWRDLEAVAGRFSRDTRNTHNWVTAFEDMGWDTDTYDQLCGIDLDTETSPIWSVDRRFLYGYWHECFGIKQQLFLIFIRAEPMMMGGGATGQIPPQLGARAVALVWRDPHRGKESNAPHRTRVLFYRQFD